jgi:DNA polymerase I-like protein with 3'-5' exonuclease and polymerase domains
MLLQVHDELVFDAHNSELEKIQPMIKHGKCIQTRCTVNC